MLAYMYFSGEGGEKSLDSLKEARYWYHKAAEQGGHPTAQPLRLIEKELNKLEERQQNPQPLEP